MELLETEIEIYNSKLRNLNWVYEEIKLFDGELRNIVKEKGKDLPINL